MLVRVTGIAAVFDENDELVTDRRKASVFDGYRYDAERFTDYIGGPPAENLLAAVLKVGGVHSQIADPKTQ